tara:strand:- start:254 stop:496 length:243 start_codon:yes stop_codon:yes gene_type:complete
MKVYLTQSEWVTACLDLAVILAEEYESEEVNSFYGEPLLIDTSSMGKRYYISEARKKFSPLYFKAEAVLRRVGFKTDGDW